MSVSTKNLKRTLGKKELFAVAIGQIVGAGIMTLTGLAIAMTGRSVNIAFLLASIAVIFASIPTILLTSAVRMRGGTYTQTAAFIGKRAAGIQIFLYIISNISLGMYAISFAQYFNGLFPDVSPQLVAGLLVTVIFIVNYLGVSKAAKAQGVLVLVLLGALMLFIGFGVGEIQPGYFQNPGFTTNGLLGVCTAMALVTFATGGATVVVNLSAEAKNPKKDIPFVIIVSTIFIAVLYAFMGTVASGVLPIEVVAGQPLTHVAEAIFPKWLYVLFIVGGAMFALITTMNAQVSYATKPVMQACVDNWFPKSLAVLHPKYNTPYRLLMIFYIIAMFPIVTGLNIEIIASSSLILNYILFIILNVGVLWLPKLYPEQWKKSPFYIKKGAFTFLIILSLVILIAQLCLMINTLSTNELIGNVIAFVLAVIFGVVRSKKVELEISTEEE